MLTADYAELFHADYSGLVVEKHDISSTGCVGTSPLHADGNIDETLADRYAT